MERSVRVRVPYPPPKKDYKFDSLKQNSKKLATAGFLRVLKQIGQIVSKVMDKTKSEYLKGSPCKSYPRFQMQG